jgi:hypothetical protein
MNDNDKKFSFLYWTANFHKNLPYFRARCPTRSVATELSLILREIRNKFKACCSGTKKFSNFNPNWSVSNSLQVIDSLAMLSDVELPNTVIVTQPRPINSTVDRR